METKVNQRNRIVTYLAHKPGATVRDIFNDLLINSPTKRLSELMKNMLVVSVPCTEVNAHGEIKRFCRYYLREENNDA